MNLETVIKTYERHKWIHICGLHKLDKWHLMKMSGESVYASYYLIDKKCTVETRVCYKCSTLLDIKYHKGDFIVKKKCDCGKDGTYLMTRDKLECVLTKEQTDYFIRTVNEAKCKGLANTLHYWTNNGVTNPEEIALKVKSTQASRSQRSPAAKKGVKEYSVRCVEYWVRIGYSQEDAMQLRRQNQISNGLEYYLKKHGEKGRELYKERIERWLSSPGYQKMIQGRSLRANSLFENLDHGHYGPSEQVVNGQNKRHAVDYIYKNKIIEFYGDYWHANPSQYKAEDSVRNKRVIDIWEHDRIKVEDLKNAGYNVMIIWESDYVADREGTITRCREFIR